MRKASMSTKLIAAAAILVVLGFISACDVGPGASVNVSSQCSGICQGSVPSSLKAVPNRAAGSGTYTKHRLPGYAQGGTVYVPTSSEYTQAGGIVFCPPMTGVQIMYAAWGPFFASYGIILTTIDTTTTFDPVDTRALEHANAVRCLLNDSGVSHILDKTRVGVCGWSMGGGSTWINASKANSGLKTAMSFAGHNLTAMNKGYGIKIPVVLFNGATDYTILGGLGQSEGVYGAVAGGVPKEIYVTAMGGHMNWGSPAQAGYDIARVALAFQKTFLHDDGRWARLLEERPSGASLWMNNIVVQ